MDKVLIFENKASAEQSVPLNKIIKLKIEEKVICMTRTSAGFFAFEKECPHMTDDLSRGNINNQNEIVCPWHAYRFNLKTGEESAARCRNLDVYELNWESDQLFLIIR